jgi:nucleoside-diphosphate-sugar epimerase
MAHNVLVTGGAGYLGSTMVPMLLAAGHKVTVVDNFMFKQASLNQLCYDTHFDVVRGDIRSKALMAPLLAKADVIIPLAAYVGAPLCSADPVGAQTVNHDAVLMMLDHVSADQAVLMPTTNSAYGTGDENNFCTEDSPLRPISQYAIDKVAVERKLMDRKNSISFRLATVFGMSPRMRLDLLVNDFTWRAVNDRFIVLFEGHFKRNYIHVRDVARAFLHGLGSFETMRGEIYNVGMSDANLSKIELCQVLKRQLPEFYFVEAEVGKDPDQRNYIVSNAKLEATGYKPSVTIDDGISELIKGFRMIRNSVHGNV